MVLYFCYFWVKLLNDYINSCFSLGKLGSLTAVSTLPGQPQPWGDFCNLVGDMPTGRLKGNQGGGVVSTVLSCKSWPAPWAGEHCFSVPTAPTLQWVLLYEKDPPCSPLSGLTFSCPVLSRRELWLNLGFPPLAPLPPHQGPG